MHRFLAGLLNLTFVDLGSETEGFKLKPKEEVMRTIGPVMTKHKQLISTHIAGLSTGTPETVDPDKLGLYANIAWLKFSGTAITYDTIERLERALSEKIIPMYGHFAAMSSTGFKQDGSLTYYPTEPFTKFLVLKEDGEPVGYGERGSVVIVAARPELLYIEEATMKPSPSYQGVDGAADISRTKQPYKQT